MEHLSLLTETVNGLPGGVCVLDSELRVVALNQAFLELLRLPPEYAQTGTSMEDIVAYRAEAGDRGADGPQISVSVEMAQLAARAPRHLQRARSDGVMVEERYRPLEGGGVLVTMADVTEGARARQALVASDQFLRAIIEAVPVAIFVIDRAHRITHWNRACAALTGYSAEQMIGTQQQWRAFYGSERPVMADLIVDGASEAERSHHYGEKYRDSAMLQGACEAEDYFPDLGDSGKWLFFTAAPLRDSHGEIVGAIETLQDITERKRVSGQLEKAYAELEQRVADRTHEIQVSNRQLEETLAELQNAQSFMVQSEKMASIGQLAAGVAHEINNPTGFVASNLNSLRDYVADITRLIGEYRAVVDVLEMTGQSGALPDRLARVRELERTLELNYLLEDLDSLVEESREGTDRIRRIVQALKDFAHPGEGRMQYADINELIASTLNVVNNEIKYKAKVVRELGALPKVKCLAQELNQVFVNLLVNAAQAIDAQGEISIRSRPVAEDWVEVQIQDTGSGISKDQLNRIFDPFFTTKEVGKGTGLGLNVVYSIITKHNGTVEVESELGRGTTFVIRLPVEPESVGATGEEARVGANTLTP